MGEILFPGDRVKFFRRVLPTDEWTRKRYGELRRGAKICLLAANFDTANVGGSAISECAMKCLFEVIQPWRPENR